MDVEAEVIKIDLVEFRVGDHVTFRPFEKSYDSIVIEIKTDNLDFNRVFYELRGRGKASVVTNTSGSCILQSRYYKEDDGVV